MRTRTQHPAPTATNVELIETNPTPPEEDPVKTVLLVHNRADHFTEVVPDVLEIISATYQKKDVTSDLRGQLLLGSSSSVWHPQSESLNFKGENLDQLFNYGLTPLSKFFYTERRLKITYKSRTHHAEMNTLQQEHSSLTTRLHTAERNLEEAERNRSGSNNVAGGGTSSNNTTSSNAAGGQCCICLDASAQFLMLPCKHLCMCGDCRDASAGARQSWETEKCPICRNPVTSTMQVFTA